jgi:UDP:flavonoid glycosyltransferase YjiC (YdhE family)
MANLLYAWEFGAGMGHIGAFLPLARALREQGHQVEWAVVSPTAAARILDKEEFTWLQAPTCPEQFRQGPPLSYADILLRFGYANPAVLLGLTVGWRELIRLTGAQALIADHAPTALLAARTMGLPVVLYSSGFCVPPGEQPSPNMRPWLPLPIAQLQALEDAALSNINRILARFGQPDLHALWQLFDVEEDTLLGFPELDHYANRGTARYWGNLPDAGVGTLPLWPNLPGKRLFAYLRQECHHHEAVLEAMRSLGLPAVIFFPDAPDALLARFASPHMGFSREPLDLASVVQEVDVAITYASLSTTTRFLLAGKPLLLLPWHLEQFMMARRVSEMGAGIFIDPEKPPTGLAEALMQIIETSDFAANAQAFARKYAAFTQEVVVNNLVRRIEEIVQ